MSLALLAGLLALSAWVQRPLLARFGAGVPFHLARLPGNLLHEASHAVATLLCGYTVVGFNVSLFDPRGRGEVRPGPAWLPVARPWLANLIAPVAPVFAGVAALAWLARYATDWRDPWAWAAAGLAFPIGAELCPSEIDLRAWLPPAFVVGAIAGAVAWWRPELFGWVGALDAPLVAVLEPAIAVAAMGTAAWAPVCVLAGWARR
ncbi:MAG: hypothetical protein ACOZNI_32880 [Myxococcota bacterium]